MFWADGWTLKWLTSHSAWAWSFEVSEQYSFWDETFLFVYSTSISQVLSCSERSKDHFKLLSGQNYVHRQWVIFSVLAWNPLRKQNPVLFCLCFVTISPSVVQKWICYPVCSKPKCTQGQRYWFYYKAVQVWVLGGFSTRLAHPIFQINSYLYTKH